MVAMPLTDDMEEAHFANEFLATGLLTHQNMFVNGDNLEHLVQILGTIANKKQSKTETLEKIAVFMSTVSQDATLEGKFKALMGSLDEEKKGRLQELFASINEDMRTRVTASLAS